MKCPFRKVKRVKSLNLRETITIEDFEDCYENDCPFYKKVFNKVEQTIEYKCNKDKRY